MAYDIEVVRDAAATRWAEIVAHLAGIDSSMLDGKHHPCPKCGGTDRFRFFADETGGAICNQCFTTKNGDGFSFVQWLLGRDFVSVLGLVADYLGIKPSKNGRKRKGRDANPAEHLEFRDWNEILVSMWCARKPPITPEAVHLIGGRLATYRSQWQVIALPVRRPLDPAADPIGWVIYPLNGKTLPAYSENGSVTWVKIKTMPGTQPGFIGHFVGGATIVKTEGPSDALALLSQGPADFEDVVCNVHGAKEDPRKLTGLLDYFWGKDVIVVHDADEAGEKGATYVEDRPGWAPFAAEYAASCKHVRLPYEIRADHGNDLRDYFSGGHTRSDFDHLVAEAAPFDKPIVSTTSAIESVDDPHRLARINLERYATRFDGATIRNWRDEWYVWKKNRYRKIPPGELEAKICLAIKSEFDRLNIEEQQDSQKEVRATKKVTQGLTRNVLAATKSMVVIPAHLELGTWIDDATGCRERRQLIALENGLLDVEALLADKDDVMLEHSPRWFSTVCLPYEFGVKAQCPKWSDFLKRNLDGDQERMDLLQEWAGYMLLPDTGQQSFLVLEGEGANGKSVFLAAIEAMLGEDNCAHVPLELFGDRFSRTQTLGKLANIAPDVGELDKPAEGHLKSFTSGEKMFFDRKNLAGLEAYPTARLMIACNNRPRFSDKSDGIWRRMIPVPFNVRIEKSERIRNMDKPWWWVQSGELPGILLWAIRGLNRLRERGSFTDPEICAKTLADYKTENNPARQFFEEKTRPASNGSVQCAELYDRYKRWCVDNGFRSLSSRAFGKEVKRFYCTMMERKQDGCAGRAWRYFGIENVFDGANEQINAPSHQTSTMQNSLDGF